MEKKQWLARRGSRLAKNGSGSQARTLVKLFTLPSKGYFELEPVHLH